MDDANRTITIRTRDDLLALSYYTLCKVSDRTMRASVEGILHAIHTPLVGKVTPEFKGRLTVDHLGNYVSFE